MQDHFALLVQTSRLLGSSLELQTVLDTLMAHVIEVLGAERGLIMLREEEGESWKVRSLQSLEPDNLQKDEFRISRGIVEDVIAQGRPILTSDALQDERFRGRASVGLYNLRSILCVPLLVGGRRLGVIYVDNRLTSSAFEDRDQQLLEAIAVQAAVAIENALLYEKLRRAYEEALQQARSELAATQAQLLHASKMNAVGQLAAGVAHEINNPLGAIKLNLTALLSATSEPLAQKRLSTAHRACEHCQSIVGRLLTFARPSQEELEPLDLAQVAQDALELAEADLQRSSIRIERDLQSCTVQGNRVELSQLFLNLLLNARDALKDTPQPRIRISTRPFGAIVEDNGPGIPPEVAGRIFEPFFTTGKGVGLGLSICYQIAQKHGATLEVQSAPGQGARFQLKFD